MFEWKATGVQGFAGAAVCNSNTFCGSAENGKMRSYAVCLTEVVSVGAGVKGDNGGCSCCVIVVGLCCGAEFYRFGVREELSLCASEGGSQCILGVATSLGEGHGSVGCASREVPVSGEKMFRGSISFGACSALIFCPGDMVVEELSVQLALEAAGNAGCSTALCLSLKELVV